MRNEGKSSTLLINKGFDLVFLFICCFHKVTIVSKLSFLKNALKIGNYNCFIEI